MCKNFIATFLQLSTFFSAIIAESTKIFWLMEVEWQICGLSDKTGVQGSDLRAPFTGLYQWDWLKTMGTFGNCQRSVFLLGVSQQMHKITNL